MPWQPHQPLPRIAPPATDGRLPGGLARRPQAGRPGLKAKAEPQRVWLPTGANKSPRASPEICRAILFLASEMVPMRSPRALLLYLLVITEGWGQEPASPGCHLYPFNVTVRSDRQGTCQGSHVAQACVGHCESSAFPSRYSVLVASGYRHNITSISQCCTISSLRKVKVQLQCGGTRREELEFYTARACQCDMCRLSRY